MKRQRNHRGASLPMVLVLSVLAVLVSGSLLGLAHQQTAYSVKLERQNRARDYAESVILLAISRLKEDPTFAEELRWSPDAHSDRYAELTFDQARPRYSTNNLNSPTAVGTWHGVDQRVPKFGAHLVATGYADGETYSCEAFIHVPPFPYSVATEGRFVSTGALEVFQVDSLEALAAGVTDEEKVAGSLASNARDLPGQPSVVLSQDSRIWGDVVTGGTVQVGPSSGPGDLLGEVVKGQIKAHHEPVPIQPLDPADWDPSSHRSTGDFVPSPHNTVFGRQYRAGDTLVNDLTLEDGLLFIDGDLTITGHVRGRGAIVCTGNVVVTGSMDIGSDYAAIVAGGDLTLAGSGADVSRFQGVAYAGGAFHASNVQIVGAFLQGDGEAETMLHNVTAVNVPELTEITIESGGKLLEGGWDELEVNYGVSFVEKTLKDFPMSSDGTYDLNQVSSLIEFTYRGNTYTDWTQLPHGLVRDTVKAKQIDLELLLAQQINTANAEFRASSDKLFHIDLNEFLGVRERIYMLMWRRLR